MSIHPSALEDIQIPDMPMASPMAFGYPQAGAQGTDASRMIMAMIAARGAERAESQPQNVQHAEQPDHSGAIIGGVAAGAAVIGLGVAAGVAASGESSSSDTQAADTPAPAPAEPAQPAPEAATPPKTKTEAKPPEPAPEPQPKMASPNAQEEAKAKYVADAQAEYQKCLSTPGKVCLQPDVSDTPGLQ
jgi:hypothetical protein